MIQTTGLYHTSGSITRIQPVSFGKILSWFTGIKVLIIISVLHWDPQGIFCKSQWKCSQQLPKARQSFLLLFFSSLLSSTPLMFLINLYISCEKMELRIETIWYIYIQWILSKHTQTSQDYWCIHNCSKSLRQHERLDSTGTISLHTWSNLVFMYAH